MKEEMAKNETDCEYFGAKPKEGEELIGSVPIDNEAYRKCALSIEWFLGCIKEKIMQNTDFRAEFVFDSKARRSRVHIYAPGSSVSDGNRQADRLIIVEKEAIEKAAQEEPAPQACEDYFILPDSDSQKITITPEIHGAVLRLDKSGALKLAAIIQDCAHKL